MASWTWSDPFPCEDSQQTVCAHPVNPGEWVAWVENTLVCEACWREHLAERKIPPARDRRLTPNRVEFRLEFDMTGPAVAVPMSTTLCVPHSAVVTVVVEDGYTYPHCVEVTGHRAKADGTAGKGPSIATFRLYDGSPDVVPPQVQELAHNAEAIVDRWVSSDE